MASRACLMVLALALGACTSARETLPQRTATEQLLLSSAVDHALDRLDLQVPRGTRLWVDAGYFDAFDEGYAIGAIRDELLRRGGRLVRSRDEADAVVEIRAGALSVDEAQTLVGIPSVAVPVPLTGVVDTPELSLL